MSNPSNGPFLLRPIRIADLPDLQNLASSLRGGLTSLPKDKDFLQKKIMASLRAFDPLVDSTGSGNESYLFALEDTSMGVIVGTSGILARIGGFEPFYSYEVVREEIRHDALGIVDEIPTLHLRVSHKGPSEVCSLLLRPDYRTAGLGRLLSLSRFIFMAAFPKRFEDTVIAEIRGVVDQSGHSPFWEAVARPFFKQDFQTADFWSGLGNKEFISDLMPKYPIYIPLLPESVKQVIGEPHPRARPAFKILNDEGFVKTNLVDIFDAGPVVRAPRKGIRTVNETRELVFAKAINEGSQDGIAKHAIAKRSLDFRACLGTVEENPDGTVNLTHEVARVLEVSPGEKVLFAPLHMQK